MNLNYPSIESVSDTAKKISYVFDNYISKMSNAESEDFSKTFYEFLGKVGYAAHENNLSDDALISYYKAVLFLNIYDVIMPTTFKE